MVDEQTKGERKGNGKRAGRKGKCWVKNVREAALVSFFFFRFVSFLVLVQRDEVTER